jgi:signal transduction histidine kinase
MGAVAVNDVLRNMEGFISPQLESKNLGYSYSCEDESLTANADAAKLEQVVLNLLANAIKFTQSGGAISLECAACSDRVHIQVRDTGIGIPPNKLEAIFEPFVQIRARGSSIGGTGLGLPISRRLAVAMGGELTATSVEGSGSTFTLILRSLPANTARDAEPEVSAKAESAPTKE